MMRRRLSVRLLPWLMRASMSLLCRQPHLPHRLFLDRRQPLLRVLFVEESTSRIHVVARHRAHYRQVRVLDAKTSDPSSSQISKLPCGRRYRPTVGHVDLAKYIDVVPSASTVLIAHTVSTKFKLNRRQAATLRRRCAAMAAMEEVLVRKVQRTLPPPGADDEANAAAINQLREWCMVRHSRPDVPPFE